MHVASRITSSTAPAGVGCRQPCSRTRITPQRNPLRCQREHRYQRSRLHSNASSIVAKVGGAGTMLVYVPPHPLVQHWLAILRSKQTPSPMFRSAMAELGRVLIYEAARDWLPTMEVEVETPMGISDATVVDVTRPVIVVPVLRAGLVPLEQASTVLPAMVTYHVGLIRDEKTLMPIEYLNKLPKVIGPDERVLVSDPMMATGGSMVHVLKDLVSRGATPSLIRVICITCAPPALKQLSDLFPGLKVYTACIDPELNEAGYIVPGLGDAGDRAFGTPSTDQFGN